MNLVEKMMFSVHRSRLDFEETVAALRESAQEHGWIIPIEHDLQETYLDAGLEEMTKLTTLYLCFPEGGYRILQDDAHKPMAVMMPLGVSVYETTEGEVYVAGMSLERMSMMFGGTVKEVLSQGAEMYAQSVAGFTEPEEMTTPEVEVDKGKCCLGCLGLTAVVVALFVGMIALMMKVMPSLMTRMMRKRMPQMMERMEEAGVRPPCAQIILEYLEEQES